MVLLICALVLGPLVTDTPHTYFQGGQPLLYVLRNMSLWLTDYHLPGVFTHTPYPGVNGSIWTLTYEARCYVVVAIIGLLGLLRYRWSALAALLAVSALVHHGGSLTLRRDAVFDVSVRGRGRGVHVREQLPLRWELAAALIVTWLLLSKTALGPYLVAVAVPYAAIVIAFPTPASWRRVTARGDFSYGIYVWSFPLQQLTAFLLPGVTPLEMIAVSLPVSYIVGAASWLLVEERALGSAITY